MIEILKPLEFAKSFSLLLMKREWLFGKKFETLCLIYKSSEKSDEEMKTFQEKLAECFDENSGYIDFICFDRNVPEQNEFAEKLSNGLKFYSV